MDYDFWLRSVRKCANNTAVKYIKNFKKIIRLCIANGWLSKDPFLSHKAKLKVVERTYLTKEEIHMIYDKEFVSDRLNQVRDIKVSHLRWLAKQAIDHSLCYSAQTCNFL
jgi:hypothetical protein